MLMCIVRHEHCKQGTFEHQGVVKNLEIRRLTAIVTRRKTKLKEVDETVNIILLADRPYGEIYVKKSSLTGYLKLFKEKLEFECEGTIKHRSR